MQQSVAIRILLQIRHNALRVNRISIHHSPLRDHNNVLCKVHHPISRYRLLDLRLTTTLLSRSIPISNRDNERPTLALRRYPSPKSVRIVVQDAL